jgi:uncharacterized protein YjbI with pentapeptide repeats
MTSRNREKTNNANRITFHDFTGKDISQIDLSDAPAVDLTRSIGRYKTIIAGKIPGAICKQADLRGANIRHTDASNGRFQMSDLRGAIFYDCNLKNTDFSGILGTSTIFYRCNLQESVFEGAYLKYTNFIGCNMESSNLERAYIEGSNFKNNNLKFTDFYQSRMRDAYIDDSNNLFCVLGFWSDLEILKSVHGSILAYRFQAKDDTSPFHGITYKLGNTYEVENISHDRRIGCAEGLHVTATKDWCISAGIEDLGVDEKGQPNFDLLEVKIKCPVDIIAPIDKGRFRVGRFTIHRILNVDEWWNEKNYEKPLFEA